MGVIISHVDEGTRAEVFRKWVPRKVFWPKRGKTPECCEDFITINFMMQPSTNNIRVFKSRRMKHKGHVALMGENRVVYMVLVRYWPCRFHIMQGIS